MVAVILRRLQPLRHSAMALVLTLGLGHAAGCDYFKPADPEPPSESSVIIPNYSQPELTLETMAKGIEDKGRTNGLSAYSGGFADTTLDSRGFHAFFDPQTINRMEQRNVDIPPDWDLGREEQFYSKFVTLSTVPLNSEYNLLWSKDETPGEDIIEAESAILHKEYRVFAILPGAELRFIARGFTTLYFIKVSANRWAIVRWDDREATDANIAQGELCLGERRLEP